ncbi:MAG: HEPN domain-containing protein [Sphaerochaetaceae bacterium]|nr:HEPN domain-containing protein [Sphaerochaetaceae bacterium]
MKKIELLIAFNIENGDLRSKENFLSLLAINGEIKLAENEIIYREDKYQFSLDMIQLNEDVYNAFLLTLNSKKIDEKFREFIKSLKKTIGACANEHIFTIWDDISQVFCTELYPEISEVENLMRKLIFQFMFSKLGIGWQNIAIPSSITETVKNKKKSKKTNIIYQLDFIHLASFLFTEYQKKTFNELREIIKEIEEGTIQEENYIENLKDFIPTDNWTRYFSEILECESGQLKKKWEQLYEIRCIVAHNNTLVYSEYEEGKTLCNYLKDILLKAIQNLQEIVIPEEERESVSQQTFDAVEKNYNSDINNRNNRYNILNDMNKAAFEYNTVLDNWKMESALSPSWQMYEALAGTTFSGLDSLRAGIDTSLGLSELKKHFDLNSISNLHESIAASGVINKDLINFSSISEFDKLSSLASTPHIISDNQKQEDKDEKKD